MLKYLIGFVCSLAFVFTLQAQPCATLQIQGPSGGIPCDTSVMLTANITFPNVFNTDQYTGSVIPYAPEPWTGSNAIIANIDDCWSGVLQLPFPFCFFGQVYNSCVVGANGQVSFDTVNTQPPLVPGSNPWASNGWVCPFSNIAMNNCILTPYHDLLPDATPNQITWDIFGIAPCRKMVVNWRTVPMFSCTSQIDSQQVVLYETTNVIDINIGVKPLCTTWNGGVAHEGIQNATGTVAYMTPGRNGTQWTANNDSYRFSPSGTSTPITYSYTWLDSATLMVLGTDDTLILPPPVTVDAVICQVNISGGCLPYSFADTFHLEVGKVNADFSFDYLYGCEEDTVVFTNLTTPALGTTYYWTFGDPSAPSTVTDPQHVYLNQIPYYVTLVATNAQCVPDTVIKQVNFTHPLLAVMVVQAGPTGFPGDSVCLGDWFKANAASSLPGVIGQAGLQYDWDWGDGTPHENGVITSNAGHIYTTPGTYTLTLVITDSIGCTDTARHTLYVDQPAYDDFVAIDSIVCVGDPINFNDTVAPNSIRFLWDFADGKTLPDVHNPIHTYDIGGAYNVTLTSYYPICPPHTTTKTVIIEDFPELSLGSDTSICPGITQTIILNNIMNPNEVLTWSTGDKTNNLPVTTSGHYWAVSTSTFGQCSTTDSIWIQRDCYLNIPNAFSPNGDGLNDYFIPRELLSSGLSVFRMNIYNRWGENIFTTSSIDGRGWDGKFNGKLQNQGVYVYIIDAMFKNGVKKTYEGNVTLLK
ncbi:MAG: PKD domain-containing protein [Chitinophagaceae bacterium]|nr:PKD domain-containing protein [Chitinophagaceae bacterium]